jgi:hypothetical protein
MFLAAAVSLTALAADTPAALPQFKLLKTIPTGGEGKWD